MPFWYLRDSRHFLGASLSLAERIYNATSMSLSRRSGVADNNVILSMMPRHPSVYTSTKSSNLFYRMFCDICLLVWKFFMVYGFLKFVSQILLDINWNWLRRSKIYNKCFFCVTMNEIIPHFYNDIKRLISSIKSNHPCPGGVT